MNQPVTTNFLLQPLIHELEQSGKTYDLALARSLEVLDRTQQQVATIQQQMVDQNKEIANVKETGEATLTQAKKTNGRVNALEQARCRNKWALAGVISIVTFLGTVFASRIDKSFGWLTGEGEHQLTELVQRVDEQDKDINELKRLLEE